MDPRNQPTSFRESIRNDRSRAQAYLVTAGAVVVVGLGLAANLLGGGDGETSPALPPTGPPVATATGMSPATPRAAAGPTPTVPPAPTPVPTLAPMVAAITTAELAPTGVLVADTGEPALDGLVADVDGTVWTTRAGAVLNVDPRTGRARAWTLADDPVFATSYLAPSRRGGVWLVTREAIHLFDGERFRVVIETPEALWSVAEGRDGSLWAQTGTYGLVRWADGVWAGSPPGRQGHGASSIVVDDEGRVWTVDLDGADGFETPRGISVWDGSAWTTFTPGDLPRPVFGGSLPELVAGGDGTVWAIRGSILVRFDAGEPTSHQVEGLTGSAFLSAVGEDGRLWFVRGDCESCDVQIQVEDGSTLTTYDANDGLPRAEDVGGPGVTVLAANGDVLAATDAGLYRLTDRSWQRLNLSDPPGSSEPGSGPEDGVASLAAISRTDVWAVTGSWWSGAPGSELFSLTGATWHRQRLPGEAAVGQVGVGPDDALWVATSSGPMVHRDGTWIDLGDTVAGVVPEPGEVDSGCGGAVLIGSDGVAYYAGPRSGNRLVALRLVRDAWKARLRSGSAPDLCSLALAATADGTFWLLQRGWGNILSRSAGGPWEGVVLPPADEVDTFVNPSAIVVDRGGSLWVAMTTWDPDSDVSHTSLIQLVDGQWVLRGDGEGIEYVAALAQLADGSLIAVGDGIATFDGQRWRQSWRHLWLNAVSVAADGTVWVAGPNVYRLPPSLP